MTYQLVFSSTNPDAPSMVYRICDASYIPFEDSNPDYLAYVAWLFEGNTPEEWNPEVTQPDMEEGN